jgi:hypothetical protein
VRQKGQSSVEYLFVVALALMIIVPGSMIFYSYSNNSKDALVHSQVFKVGNTLVDTALKLYSIGDGSWETIELSLPEQIDSIYVYNTTAYSELVITYGKGALSDGVFFSEVQLCNETSCNCTTGCVIELYEGINNVRVLSEEGKVYIRVVG